MTYQKHTLQTIIIFTYERCHNQRGITALKEMDKCIKISNPFDCVINNKYLNPFFLWSFFKGRGVQELWLFENTFKSFIVSSTEKNTLRHEWIFLYMIQISFSIIRTQTDKDWCGDQSSPSAHPTHPSYALSLSICPVVPRKLGLYNQLWEPNPIRPQTD